MGTWEFRIHLLSATRESIPDAGARRRQGMVASHRVARRSPRPHVLLLAGRREVARVERLGLARLSEPALVAAVHPAVAASRVAHRVLNAARCAQGLPGRLVERLWGTPRHGAVGGASCAAERAPEYSVTGALFVAQSARGCSGPAQGELVRWRATAERAADRLRAGRAAAGERELRAVAGALILRSDWLPAARGLLALAAAHLARAPPLETQVVLRQIDSSAGAVLETGELQRETVRPHSGTLTASKTLPNVLTAALVAARDLGDQWACWSIRLPLATRPPFCWPRPAGCCTWRRRSRGAARRPSRRAPGRSHWPRRRRRSLFWRLAIPLPSIGRSPEPWLWHGRTRSSAGAQGNGCSRRSVPVASVVRGRRRPGCVARRS